MKPASFIISFTISAAARIEAVGNIRAASLDGQQATVVDKMSLLSGRGGKMTDGDASAAAARHERSRRKVEGDRLHDAIIRNMGLMNHSKTRDVKKTDLKDGRNLNGKMTEKDSRKGDEDRKLKKTKSNKGGYNNEWNGGSSAWDDDNWRGGNINLDVGDEDRKDSGDWSTEVYSGKSGKEIRSGRGSGTYSGSGKSGKYSGLSDESCSDYAYVEVTNVSYEQSLSELFIMTASQSVTEFLPLFVYGNRTNDALASLSQDADASEMAYRYMNRQGVEMVKIFNDFEIAGVEESFLRGGARATFKVRTSGNGERLSIAAGLPFTNDGAVILQGEHIYDKAEYWVAPIDSGAEANIQTCWSVAAKREDFPPRSVCADSDNTSENYNDLPGEGFVSMHRGMHDLDSESDLQDVLNLVECDELDIDENSNERFATFFYELGYDDDFLLCSNAFGTCDPRDDQDFLNTLEDLDDLFEDRYVELARESKDFDAFCASITAVNNEMNDLFKTLEPWLFDWRNAVMHVKVSCGWQSDGWTNGREGNNSTSLQT